MRLFLLMMMAGFTGISAQAQKCKIATVDPEWLDPQTLLVVLHTPGPKWNHGKLFFEQVGVRDHALHYKKFSDAGKIYLGGPFLDSTGGMMVAVPGTDLTELVKFAEADPAIISGLLSCEVRYWQLKMFKK